MEEFHAIFPFGLDQSFQDKGGFKRRCFMAEKAED